MKKLSGFILILALIFGIFTGCKANSNPVKAPDNIFYTVFLDSNNGSGDVEVQSGEFGKHIILNENFFTYPKHTYVGWSTKADSSLKSADLYREGDEFLVVKNTTLYANWLEHDYTITFDFNNSGENIGTEMEEHTFASSVDTTLPRCTFGLEGMGFRGWATEPGSKEIVYKDGEYLPAGTFAEKSDNKDITLYAVWETPDYFVTFNAGYGTGTMAKQGFFKDEPQKLIPCTFTRSDYVLKGWTNTTYYYDDSSTIYTDEEEVVLTEDITLYAVWTKYKTILKYSANGGSGTMSNEEFFYSSGITVAANKFTRTHYSFKGWNTKSDGSGISYAPGSKLVLSTLESEVILYAQWEILQFTLSYDINRPSYESYSYMYGTTESTSVDFGQTAFVKEPNYTVSHFTFKCWNTKANGTGTSYYKGNPITLTEDVGNVTLYAIWTPKTYTITYHQYAPYYQCALSEKTLVDKTYKQTYTYGSQVSLITPSYSNGLDFTDVWKTRTNGKDYTTNINYKFIGWTTYAYYTSSRYSPYSTTSWTNCTLGDEDFYAIWGFANEYPYTIIYANRPGTDADTEDIIVDYYPYPSSLNEYKGKYINIGFTDYDRSYYAEYMINKKLDEKVYKNSLTYDSTNKCYYKPKVLYGVWFEYDKYNFNGTMRFEYEPKPSTERTYYTRIYSMDMSLTELTGENYYKVMGLGYSNYKDSEYPVALSPGKALYFIDKLNYLYGREMQYFISDEGNTSSSYAGTIDYSKVPTDNSDPRYIYNLGENWFAQIKLTENKKLFCAYRLNSFRLPTEYEWVYAANCYEGSSGCVYPNFEQQKWAGGYSTRSAWCKDTSGGKVHTPWEDTFKRNNYQMTNFSGNLAEYVHPFAYHDAVSKDLKNPALGTPKVKGVSVYEATSGYFRLKVCGGHYNSTAEDCVTFYGNSKPVSVTASDTSYYGIRLMRQNSWMSLNTN